MKKCSQRGCSCSCKIWQGNVARSARPGAGAAPAAAPAPPGLSGSSKLFPMMKREVLGAAGTRRTRGGQSFSLLFILASSHLKEEPVALAPK